MKTQTDKASNCYCAHCKCNRAFVFDCISDQGVEKHRCLACGHLYSTISSASVASDSPNQSNETRADCRHCGRSIICENGQWIDPQATGDDSIWRETCDSHDTFNAIHEPKPTLQTMYKVNTGPRRNRYFKTLQRAKVYCDQVFERSRVVLSIVETKH